MRILMFGWEFPPLVSGGLGTACYEISRTLARHGNEITFVVPRTAPPEVPVAVELVDASRLDVAVSDTADQFLATMDIAPLDSILRPYLDEATYQERRQESLTPPPEGIPQPPPIYGENLIAEVARYSEVAEALATGSDFDIIHAHDWMTYLAAIRAKRATGKPLVVHVHSVEFDRSGGSPDPHLAEIERRGMEAADHIIAVSHYTRNLIIQHYGIDPSRISVVHNAVSRRRANRVYHTPRQSERKTVLFLGRITSQKGPDFFVEAAARVVEYDPEIMFVMAGAGDMLPRMIERVGELRLGRNFHFTGFLQGHDVERLYAMSDLYVMPSVSEPFGISPLEAMLYDVPVLISRNAGVTEILPGALTVDFWDIESIASKILAVLKYPALSREMIRSGRKALRRIRWEVAAKQIQMIYGRLLA